MTDDTMTRVLDALVRVAPEIDRATVRPEVSLRDEYDLDSMDFLNFVIGLHDAFGVDIPEADYSQLATLAGCVRYLTAHAAPPPVTAPAATTHRFEGALAWDAATAGATAFDHTVTFGTRPALGLSAPPQFRGNAERLSPEELFVASVASCQLLTYLALAKRGRVAVVRYEDRPLGTLAMVDRRMRVTEVRLQPRIVLAPGADAAKARALVDAAHAACFVANSITATVRIEPEVVAS